MPSHFSHVQLFVTPWMIAYQGSSVHGILQARILEWVAVPSSRGPSQLRNATHIYSGMQLTSLVSSALENKFCTTSTTWEAPLFIYLMYVQLCPTLCDSVGCSPPGSSVHGIFQAKITGVGCQKPFQGKQFLKLFISLELGFLCTLKIKKAIRLSCSF